MLWTQLGLIPFVPILACYLFIKIADHISLVFVTYRRRRTEGQNPTPYDEDISSEAIEELPQASAPRASKTSRPAREKNGNSSAGKGGTESMKENDGKSGGVSINHVATHGQGRLTATHNNSSTGKLRAVTNATAFKSPATKAYSTMEISRMAGANVQSSESSGSEPFRGLVDGERLTSGRDRGNRARVLRLGGRYRYRGVGGLGVRAVAQGSRSRE